jgi:hypothetical protein
MIYVALDLSLNSTGVCIANDETMECEFSRVTLRDYPKSAGTKYDKALFNSRCIAEVLVKRLLPYRHVTDKFHVIVESVGYGLLKGRTNSATSLLFEGAIVSAELQKLFHASVQFVEPTKHKKLFTGNGKASKEQSVNMLFHWFSGFGLTTDKLDDIADAMSIMTVAIPNIREYKYSFAYRM